MTELRKSIDLAKHDPTIAAQSHNSLGAVLANRKDYQGAIEHFHAATALSPTSAIYFVNLANALAAIGRTTEGRQAIERAQQLNPNLGKPLLPNENLSPSRVKKK